MSASARRMNPQKPSELDDGWKSFRKAEAAHSKRLRENQTEAERIFWNAVRQKRLDGYRFRRQYPVGPYFADFACVERKLLVEIDGGQHCENKKDEIRTACLEKDGFTVLRFWNNDILENIDGVLQTLLTSLRGPHDPQ